MHIINQNKFFPFSNTKLSHIIGVNPPAIIQAVKDLVAIRLLIKSTKQGHQNSYKLIEYWELLDASKETDYLESEINETINETDYEADNEILFRFPTNKFDKEGETFNVTAKYYLSKQPIYAGLDLNKEFIVMKNWLEDNPRKRKTLQGTKTFITNWLNRSQNTKGGYMQSYSYS